MSLNLTTMGTKDGVAAVKPALVAYLKSGAPRGRTLDHFIAEFSTPGSRLSHGRPVNVDGLPVMRVLDRALQALRKAGAIVYRKGQWYTTDEQAAP